MSFIKKILLVVLLAVSTASLANTAQMNTTLARISRILSQINPLINLAQRQQDPQARVQFQCDKLRADISKIQTGITEAMNRVTIEPRNVAPLSGDYLPLDNSAQDKTP